MQNLKCSGIWKVEFSGGSLNSNSLRDPEFKLGVLSLQFISVIVPAVEKVHICIVYTIPFLSR